MICPSFKISSIFYLGSSQEDNLLSEEKQASWLHLVKIYEYKKYTEVHRGTQNPSRFIKLKRRIPTFCWGKHQSQ